MQQSKRSVFLGAEDTMGDDKPDPKAFIDNLRCSMHIQKKLFFLLKNNAIKIITAKSSCGHPGELGC